MSIMQTHSEKGEKLIVKYKDFSRGALMVKHHHESWNGHGYPGRLKEYEIPFGSRVIAVADSFDAMTSNRPYRKALSPKQAVQILIKGRGKQWDYNVVNAFVEAISDQLDDSIHTSLSESEISLALSNTISTPFNA
jgi:HD-GYP domain-containing protein (c-di-GMP phosphodiesterase class II)